MACELHVWLATQHCSVKHGEPRSTCIPLHWVSFMAPVSGSGPSSSGVEQLAGITCFLHIYITMTSLVVGGECWTERETHVCKQYRNSTNLKPTACQSLSFVWATSYLRPQRALTELPAATCWRSVQQWNKEQCRHVQIHMDHTVFLENIRFICFFVTSGN